MEKDWEDNMDASLFENVYVLEDGDEIEPIGLIRSSNSPLQNWYLAEESRPMHLESEPESESESNSSLYESYSDESEPDYPRPPCVTLHFDVNTEFGNIMHKNNLACSAYDPVFDNLISVVESDKNELTKEIKRDINKEEEKESVNLGNEDSTLAQ